MRLPAKATYCKFDPRGACGFPHSFLATAQGFAAAAFLIDIANQYALYNLLSTFSGTH